VGKGFESGEGGWPEKREEREKKLEQKGKKKKKKTKLGAIEWCATEKSFVEKQYLASGKRK